MFNSLFLDDVAGNKNKRQQLDHLLKVAAPHERIILASIGLVLLVLVIWVLFGNIVRSVTVDGVLLKPGARHGIVSTEPGHLVKFLVTPGDRVGVGEVIARQTVPELEREVAALRDRTEILEAGIRQGGGNGIHSLLSSAQEALLQMEARRTTKEVIVSHLAGEIMALNAAPGDYLPAGSVVAQLRNHEGQSLQAVLQIDSRMAQRLNAGMRAVVEVAMPEGDAREVEGEIASISSGPLPSWLSEFQLDHARPAHRVDIVLHPESNFVVPDGTPCRVRVVSGQHALVALFDPEQF